MDRLVLPCSRCAPTAVAEVTAGRDVIRCMDCGFERAFSRVPLHLVTGAPGTGKSTVLRHLQGRVGGVPILDTDLFGPWSHPDWSAWASTWLLVVYSLAQSGVRAVLCGYGISKSKITSLPPRALLGAIRAVNLDMAEESLRARLRMRPGYDNARIERKVAAAKQLRDEADQNIDVTTLDEAAVAHAVRAWLARELLDGSAR